MSQTRVRPFKTRPPSQSQTPAFYWRGGDVLREREYLADEFKKALADKRKAELDLQQIQKEIAETQEVLDEREGYTSTLANYLDSDAEGYATENEFRQRLKELNFEIQVAERELQEATAVHHPAVISSLQKEKAFLLLEIQQQNKTKNNAIEQRFENKRKLAELSAGQKYQQTIALETQYDELVSKKNFLRGEVNRAKKNFESTKPTKSATPTDQETLRVLNQERSVLLDELNISMAEKRGVEKKNRRPKKWDLRIARMIDQIEELNDRLEDLGFGQDDLVDTEQLRDKYFPPPENNDQSNNNTNNDANDDGNEQNENGNEQNENGNEQNENETQ